MLTARRYGFFGGAGVLALCLGLTSPVSGQSPDPLAEAKARLAVEAQRIELEIKQAESDARKLGRTNPALAAEKLRAIIANLENEQALPAAKRESLVRTLKYALRDLERDAADLRAGRGIDPAVSGLRGPRGEDPQVQTDAAKINRTLQEIRALQQAGKTTEAAQLANDLARQFPNNPAAQGGRITAGRSDVIADVRSLKDEKEGRVLGAFRDVDKANMPVRGDIEFPRDWKERIAKHSKGQQMTATEKAILTALNKPIAVEYKEDTFQSVIDHLQKVIGQPIIVDKQAMEEANVNPSTSTISLNLRAATRSVLRKVLADVGLAYVVKDQTIYVTTIARAKEMMTARAYYVGDLVSVVDVRFAPWINQQMAIQNINTLITQIQNSIDPGSWDVRGGPASISFEPITMSLVIRQSAEVHFMLGVGLR